MTTKAQFLEALQAVIVYDAAADRARTIDLPDPNTPEFVDLAEDNAKKAVIRALFGLKFIVTPRRGDDLSEPENFALGERAIELSRIVLQQGKQWLAYQVIRHTILHLVQRDAVIPGLSDSGLLNPAYQHLTTIKQTRLLIKCYSALIQLSESDKEYFQALIWFEEAQAVEYRSRSTASPSLYDWQQWHSTEPLLAVELFECFARAALVYRGLQNTATCHHIVVLADRYSQSLPASGNLRQNGLASSQNDLLNGGWREAMASFSSQRHPDPQARFKFELQEPRLQVCGAWKRLSLKVNDKMGRRSFCTAFVWKGYMYVAGGSSKETREDEEPSDPRDIWRARLDPPGEWEFFSKYPRPKGHDWKMFDPPLRIYEGKAYLFLGHPDIDVLDLKNGRWTRMKTTYKSTASDRLVGVQANWPYLGNQIFGASQHFVGDRLLVFGGVPFQSTVGCNLLMELNLKTRRWRRLSGAPLPMAENDPNVPGPRHGAASWIDRGKLFILHGLCERRRAGFCFNNDVGPSEPWAWNDMWSWDIEGERWRRERLAGNPPAPRYEMGYVHNQKLGKVIVFGGINPMCYSNMGDVNRPFAATFLADTFMLDTTAEHDVSSGGENNSTEAKFLKQARFRPGPYSWKQVMSCGFPTYRVGPALVCDPDTGKTYMYGGEVRTDVIPSRKLTEAQARKQGRYSNAFLRELAERPGGAGEHWYDLAERQTTRHFGHVWQLHIDIPGGDFEVIDKEEEIHTAQAGPWDRCFECGKPGFWKQCGGSCGGRAHFCDRECQLKGWSAHKKMHSCRKS